MTATWKNAEIKAFVKNTLGCGCPDKVFEKIEVSKISVEEGLKEASRIVVGDTLLIYVIHPDSIDNLAGIATAVAAAGRNDRDSNNYNRFRLVLTSIGDTTQRINVSEQFDKAFNSDEKMHIHFVNAAMLNGL